MHQNQQPNNLKNMPLQTLNTIKSWFKTGAKPTQQQFWDTWQSFWHKDEQIPQNSIQDLTRTLNNKVEKDEFDTHKKDPNAHAESIARKLDKDGYHGTAKMIDDRLSAIENPDRVLKFGTINIAGLDVKIMANAFAWVLNGVSFLTPDSYTKTITAAGNRMYRTDIVVGTESGSYEIIKGIEATTGEAASEPPVPNKKIKLGFISVFGATVSDSGNAPAIEKATIIDTDRIVIDDSGDSFSKKSVKWSVIKVKLKSWLDLFYKTWILGINSIPEAMYTINANDYKKIGVFDNVNPITFKVPINADVAIPIGTSFNYSVSGTGDVTIQGNGVTFLSNTLTFAKGTSFSLTKIDTDTWSIKGEKTNLSQFNNDIGASTPFTIFIDTVNGVDRLGVLESKSRPFKTDTAAFAALPKDDGNIWTFYFIDNNVTRILNQFPATRKIKYVCNNTGTFDISAWVGLTGMALLYFDTPFATLLHNSETQTRLACDNVYINSNAINIQTTPHPIGGSFFQGNGLIKANSITQKNNITGKTFCDCKLIAGIFDTTNEILFRSEGNLLSKINELILNGQNCRLSDQSLFNDFPINKISGSGTLTVVNVKSFDVNKIKTAVGINIHINAGTILTGTISMGFLGSISISPMSTAHILDFYGKISIINGSIGYYFSDIIIKNSTIFLDDLFFIGLTTYTGASRNWYFSNVEFIQANSGPLGSDLGTNPVNIIKTGFLKSNGTFGSAYNITDRTPNSF